MFVSGVGWANVDLLYGGVSRFPNEGEEVYSKSFSLQLGGGAPATLLNLANLGVPVQMGTFLSDDLFSNFVRQQLELFGVQYTNLHQSGGYPVCVTSVAITEKDRSFLSYRDFSPITPQLENKVSQLSQNSKIILMQRGFLPVYQQLKSKDTLFLFDGCWEEDMTLKNIEGYLEIADYFTPNRVEALTLTGCSNEQDALQVLAQYIQHPMVKLDGQGCLILQNGQPTILPALPGIQAVDSTGAGDAFLAGFAYGLYHNFSFEDSILCGNITGGTCVQAVGCLAKTLQEPQLLELLTQMKAAQPQ